MKSYHHKENELSERITKEKDRNACVPLWTSWLTGLIS